MSYSTGCTTNQAGRPIMRPFLKALSYTPWTRRRNLRNIYKLRAMKKCVTVGKCGLHTLHDPFTIAAAESQISIRVEYRTGVPATCAISDVASRNPSRQAYLKASRSVSRNQGGFLENSPAVFLEGFPEKWPEGFLESFPECLPEDFPRACLESIFLHISVTVS